MTYNLQGKRITSENPKNEKTPKDAVKIDVVEEAKKGLGYYAPYSEWEADVVSGRPEADGNWIVCGRKSMAGSTFEYATDAARPKSPTTALDFPFP